MEFYQMPLFNKLLVSDIEKTEKWYRHTLGLQSVFKFRNEENKFDSLNLPNPYYQYLQSYTE